MKLARNVLGLAMCVLIFSSFARAGEDGNEYYRAGIQKSRMRDYAGAIAEYNKAIELNPTNADAFNNRGLARDYTKDFAGAMADFDKAVQLNPKSAGIFGNRGSAKFEQNDCAGAVADMTAAIALEPKLGRAYTARGMAKRALKDFKGAAADFHKAVELSPQSATAFAGLASVQDDLREWPAALKNYRKAIELSPALKGLVFRIWLVQARQGDRDGATRDLEAALKARDETLNDDWSKAVKAFLIGGATAEEFLRAAKTSGPDARMQSQHLCSADYYIGMKFLLDGEKGLATASFKKSVATGERSNPNYASAEAELEALK